MVRLKKLLARFTPKERAEIGSLLTRILSFDWTGLDVKRLKGYREYYRIRKGDLRIVYRVADREVFVLTIERRSETTYRKL
ncbi:MAG: hypothetical protein KGI60_00835 [Patescibacteria group bacterium]|nr:hypothetical protein [Patescibacteria group bacterium]